MIDKLMRVYYVVMVLMCVALFSFCCWIIWHGMHVIL